MDRDEIITLIKQEVGKQFSNKMVGDTPNDALQLVPKKYVDGRVFSGRLNTDGTAIYLPRGWSSSLSATSEYLVTHNLGTTNYSFVVFTDSVDSYGGNTGAILATIDVTHPQANSFTFATLRQDTGAAKAAPSLFILAIK